MLGKVAQEDKLSLAVDPICRGKNSLCIPALFTFPMVFNYDILGLGVGGS